MAASGTDGRWVYRVKGVQGSLSVDYTSALDSGRYSMPGARASTEEKTLARLLKNYPDVRVTSQGWEFQPR